jgi:predicted TIM-barrel fold metal-dependent hydrolase
MDTAEHRVGILDDHCHPVSAAAAPLDLAEITLDVDPLGARRRQALGPGRLLVEAARNRLAAFLGCEPDEVEAARADRCVDWPGYVHELFQDAGVAGTLVDGGPVPLDRAATEAQQALTGVPAWSLLRIEAIADPMLEKGASADEVLAAVDDAIERAAAHGAAGCKTVLAYRTGLAVDPTATLADARIAVQREQHLPVRRRAKPLRDLLLRRALARCADVQLPMQVHTGFGDSDLRLADSDPLGLDDLLRTSEGTAAQVVLIHAAHPWHEQVAYLAATRASVWAEFSLVNLFNPVTSADRLLRLIELAPTDRVLVGSDGHGVPETNWLALHVLRDAWSEVRARLGGLARESWLTAVEERIFAANARELYRLPSPP